MDRISKYKRSELMGKIKAKSKLEDMFAAGLWREGVRYHRNVRTLKGTPDIAIKKYKIVIFVDSCFWHVCPGHFKRPKSNVEFVDKKFRRNVERDKEIDFYYEEKGWYIKLVWEHCIRKEFEKAIAGKPGL